MHLSENWVGPYPVSVCSLLARRSCNLRLAFSTQPESAPAWHPYHYTITATTARFRLRLKGNNLYQSDLHYLGVLSG